MGWRSISLDRRAAACLTLLAALTVPLAAQQAGERLVVHSVGFDGNRALDDYTLSISIATSQSPWLVRYGSAGLAWLMPLSGAGMLATMLVLGGVSVLAMWRPPPEPQ